MAIKPPTAGSSFRGSSDIPVEKVFGNEAGSTSSSSSYTCWEDLELYKLITTLLFGWSKTIYLYSFEVIHQAGSANADMLSSVQPTS